MANMRTVNDILENSINEEVLAILLCDKTTGNNIIWATDDYSELGAEYFYHSTIEAALITGENDGVVKPRIEKNKEQKTSRVRNMAEVFTPSWICNQQNNLVDDAWFGKHSNRFNTEQNKGWETNYHHIAFTDGRVWQEYVKDTRLEITCGEAPYLASRYDTVTGATIPVKRRIGLLDRKLRVISENIKDEDTWKKWAKIALQSTYGFEWQGDNVLLARENLLYTVVEHYFDKYQKGMSCKTLCGFAEIIVWNIWQMDGLKFVIPDSCHNEEIVEEQIGLFPTESKKQKCPGCIASGNRHNGIYSIIMDWGSGETLEFASLVEEG